MNRDELLAGLLAALRARQHRRAALFFEFLAVLEARQQLADDLPPDSRQRAIIVRGLG